MTPTQGQERHVSGLCNLRKENENSTHVYWIYITSTHPSAPFNTFYGVYSLSNHYILKIDR